MYKNTKIGILGGDMRQAALARRLSELGLEVATWGLERETDIGDAVRTTEWKGAVEGSRAVILPLPVSKDGVRLYLQPGAGQELRISHLFEALPADIPVLGGKLDAGIKNAALENNIPVLDYFDCEELQIKNAVPTAEGAIEIAMRMLPITIAGSNATVLGYGRIGKVLLSVLRALHAHVSVAARRPEDIAYITVFGGDPVRFGSVEYAKTLAESDVVFNTVPAKVLPRKVLENMQNCRLIVDLASGKGGTDFEAAESLGIQAVHALSLPGKVAPATAGNILCDCILELLTREGVIAK